MRAMLDMNESNVDFKEDANLEIIDTLKLKKMYQGNNQCNTQVQVLNHIKVSESNMKEYIYFII